MSQNNSAAQNAPDDDALDTIATFLANIPCSRAKFYQEVKAGRIRIVKIGRRSYVPRAERRRYIRQLLAEAA